MPILVVEGHHYTNNWIKTEQKINQDALEAAQSAAVAAFQARFPNLHYAAAQGKLGSEPDVQQDSTGGVGVHPAGTPAYGRVRRGEAPGAQNLIKIKSKQGAGLLDS